jgi:CRP-like cAMP-binding protein
MIQLSREYAEQIICKNGWLATMPEPFRAQLLSKALFLTFKPGQTLFQSGDPAGGIYGLVAGTLTVNTASSGALSRLVHIASPGGWLGEGGFITGQARRITLIAKTEVWVMHVPLEMMELMARTEPKNIRAFGNISVMWADSLLRIVYDLQIKNVSARIASALHRIASTTDTPVPVTQENLSIIANTSRQQVNNVIQHFADLGWVEIGYRSITITNPSALQHYAEKNVMD